MAERPTSLPTTITVAADSTATATTAQPDPLFTSGTFVVQVPKDLIYRTPPPENALIVERHRNPAINNNRRSCCCRYACLFAFLAIVIVVIAIVAALIPVFSRPKNPKFKINKFTVSNIRSRHEYDIKLNVENSNGINPGGRASLSFKNHEISAGKYPAGSSDVGLVLTGKSKAKLPKEVEKSLKSNKKKVRVSLLLKMNLSAKMKSGFFSVRDVKFIVSCSFTVDSLAKGSRILSQKCESQ